MIIRFKKLLQHKIDTKAQRIKNIQVRFKQKHIVETIFFWNGQITRRELIFKKIQT